MNFNLQENTQYGIMISGGLDSAILLYLILKEFKSKNLKVQIQPFTIPKHDGSYLYVEGILNYMELEFNIELPETILIGNPNAYHSIQGKIAIAEIKQKYQYIDILFFGSNRIPPINFPSLSPTRIPSLNSTIINPFFNFYKTDIIKLAIENNLQTLFNITHSCTAQNPGRCNSCWQCYERAWAFNELKLIDTGTT